MWVVERHSFNYGTGYLKFDTKREADTYLLSREAKDDLNTGMFWFEIKEVPDEDK